MIKQLSRLFSQVNIPRPTSAEQEALYASRRLLNENLASIDTFVRQEMPQIKQVNTQGLEAVKKLSESSKGLLPK